MRKYSGAVINTSLPLTGSNPIEQIVDSIVENGNSQQVPVVSERTGKPVGWVTNYRKEDSILVCEMFIDESLVKSHSGVLFVSATIKDVKSHLDENDNPIFEGQLERVVVSESKKDRSFNMVKPIE